MIRAKKFDGVIEAVHYTADGKIDRVRAYERRGFIFTDLLIFDRQTLLHRLQNGARLYVGQRKTGMGNDFALRGAIRLDGQKGGEKIIAGQPQGQGDTLEGALVF